ncbi:iron complex transport system substrate-binding protein [Rhodococcus rhodochrous J3]|jgi:iron complex transport system substrate-binding protein|uniref:Iron-siderophore ABC transporter substrate-binding protein n=2 Tax=Rhodococcus rhodochrous TaxID=1829 RepID=A0AA46WQY2_RHORH|nr:MULTISPECIES: iron-siderophore ABC transporter substrate-binding protein [Rhodococcus]AYA26488.1 iron-siderophore ABC transporter substrate-binding protein [Rhodococcus rhodochrous]MBF4479050.1 iron-siderophore ABC transporter substrate-binding protein [Rhodococcus rhodochrous]MCB8913346.1 iron-siderophore ABC transporter substrate-binding protein [Rhodococcus rhodochrous]MCD2100292.1 iron-siderophore ABC transporter substrate-binding protein [Rhodococcus rhodochrous]MCD2124214.1 iron-sider
MHKIWRRVSAAALAITFLASCGTSEPQNQPAGNADVATGGALFATADTETAKLGSDADPGVFPRTVTHALGETVLESKPTRVVVLDGGELDDVLSLGITPVGLANPESAAGQPSYLADKLDGVADVGTINNLDLEAIAALEPDLILGSKLRADQLYPQLSQIAPTVFAIRPGFPWKENFLLVADAVGEENEAVEVLNNYQRRADDIRASLDGTPPTISLVRFMSGKIRLYGNLSFIGVILQDVGLPRPPLQDVDELAVEVSPETITQAEGDRIFYTSYGRPEDTGEAAVIAGPLWNELAAVEDGRATRVSDETWFLALGPTGAMLVLDDLEEMLGS